MGNMNVLLAEVEAIAPGSHLHLDDLFTDPPAPGSREWLPILSDLVGALVGTNENWTVIFSVGSVREPWAGVMSIDRVLDVVDQSNLFEPPSVHRPQVRSAPLRWEGEEHRWLRVLGPTATEIISMSRSSQELSAGEDLEVRLVIEIRQA